MRGNNISCIYRKKDSYKKMTTPHQNVVICNLVIDDTTMIEPGMIVCSKKSAGGKLTFHTTQLNEKDVYQVVGVSLNFRAKLDRDKVKLKPIAVAVRGIIDVDTTHCTNKICGEIIQHKGIPFGTVIAGICSVSGVGSTLDKNRHRIKLEPQLSVTGRGSSQPIKNGVIPTTTQVFENEYAVIQGEETSALDARSLDASFETSSFKDAAKALKKKKKRSTKAKEV